MISCKSSSSLVGENLEAQDNLSGQSKEIEIEMRNPSKTDMIKDRTTKGDDLPPKGKKEVLHPVIMVTDNSKKSSDDSDLDVPKRKRTVSWGDPREYASIVIDNKAVPSMKGFEIHQSSANDEEDIQRKAKENWVKLKKSVHLKDVKLMNPLETEAEAAIMKVVDNVIQNQNDILPHIPPTWDTAFQENNRISAVSSSTSSILMNGHSEKEANTVDFDSKSMHRRKKTLESTLFDLGNQMDTFLNKNDKTFENNVIDDTTQQAIPRRRVVSTASMRERFFSKTDSGNLHIPMNEGDALVDNASILFRTRKDSERKYDVESASLEKNLVNIDDKVKAKIQEAAPNSMTGNSRFYTAKLWRKRWQLSYLNLFLQPRFKSIKKFLAYMIFCIIIPLLIIAAVFFYVFENPDLGREGASISWLVLFLCRQAVTCILAKGTESIIIDFLSLQLRFTVRTFGPIITLFIVQSKGYPFIMFWWGLYNFILNSGRHALARHWLWWQSSIAMFSDCCNPSGTITFSRVNYLVNGTAMIVGLIISLKRLWWGFYLGRRTFRIYGEELARVFKNMVMISEVANLASEVQKCVILKNTTRNFADPIFSFNILSLLDHQSNRKFSNEHSEEPDDKDGDDDSLSYSDIQSVKPTDAKRKPSVTGSLQESQIKQIKDLLGEWEEPDSAPKTETNVSVACILQFRQMITHMDQDFPFTIAFGAANSREMCLQSAQAIYERLIMNDPSSEILSFETISVISKEKNGDINVEKLKDLIRLFRPDRKGNLSLLYFLKSCDTVYKDMRLLKASIKNISQLNRAYEKLFNTIFFLILFILILTVFGLDTMALIISFSGIFVSFAFMIGSASSKYFEGMLFILARRPYDIGDRIAVSNVNEATSSNGSTTWFVQDVDLFTTTVRNGATNEVATYANGSLASSRIINAKRSLNACIYIYMKFSVDVPYKNIMIFKQTIEAFVRERPREWVSLDGFWVSCIATDQGYIEYIIGLTHRDSWQSIVAILNSKATLSSFCLEVSKKLSMTYTAPALPVNLTFAQPGTKFCLNSNQGLDDRLDAGKTEELEGNLAAPDIESLNELFQ